MDLSELHPHVAIEVPGAARFQIADAVSRAAREFFIATRSWRLPMDPVAIGPGTRVYEIRTPADTVLVEPVYLQVDGTRLRSDQWRVIGANAIELPAVIYGHELSGEIAIAPTLEAEEIPDRHGYEFTDAIVSGALAKLFRIPSAEWSDMNLAAAHTEMFDRAKDSAAVRAENGFKANRTRRVRYGGL